MVDAAIKSGTLGQLYQQAMRALAVGLLINIALAVLKLVAGIVSHSMAMIADAVNSMGDAMTSFVAMYAMHYAQKPADARHPYGHSRIEAIAALTVSILIAVSALIIVAETLRGVGTQHYVPPIWVIVLAGANVVIKEAVFQYKRACSKRTGSQAIMAIAWDHRSDALCSAAVLIGLLAVRIGGQSYVWVDDVAAILVAGLIFVSCIKIYRSTASSLMDEQCSTELIQAIEVVAEQTPEVVRVEKLYARRSGLEVLVDIHVEVDSQLSVEHGHRIGHHVKDRVLDELTAVTKVMVHVEPAKSDQGEKTKSDD